MDGSSKSPSNTYKLTVTIFGDAASGVRSHPPNPGRLEPNPHEPYTVLVPAGLVSTGWDFTDNPLTLVWSFAAVQL